MFLYHIFGRYINVPVGNRISKNNFRNQRNSINILITILSVFAGVFIGLISLIFSLLTQQ